ncbi:MAG: hypothetical protein QE487_00550 [Fluviicola sp.]|nr:hypothetical protein [Fluviicola sp.]
MIRSIILILLSLLVYQLTFAAIDGKDTTIHLQTEHGDIRITGRTNSMFAQFAFKASETVILEAESKNITEDGLYAAFVFDQNCQLTSVVIKRTGVLESFNREAAVFCDEILRAVNENQLGQYLFSHQTTCEESIFKIKFFIQ